MIGLHKNEKVLLLARRHWLPISVEATGYGAAVLVPFMFVVLLPNLPSQLGAFAGAHIGSLLLLCFSWTLLLWTVFFVSWTNYYLDVLVVTNKRVVDIEQIGLFARDVAETRMENVQDITVEVKGLLPSLLNFGDVYIQTAAAARELEVKSIHRPHDIKEAVAKAQEQARRRAS